MPLTFAERRQYLRDRAVNAARMIRHGNFRLFRESLVFEINHVRNLFKMWWHSRKEAGGGAGPDTPLVDRTRVLPASWRPIVFRRAPTPAALADRAALAGKLEEIRSRLQPSEKSEKKSRWPKLRF